MAAAGGIPAAENSSGLLSQQPVCFGHQQVHDRRIESGKRLLCSGDRCRTGVAGRSIERFDTGMVMCEMAFGCLAQGVEKRAADRFEHPAAPLARIHAAHERERRHDRQDLIMSDQDQPIQELLQRRLELVAGVSALTARTHKLIQEMSGTEMEILRLQLALERTPASKELAQALNAAEEQASGIRSIQAGCVAEIEAAEAAIAHIDRLIAAAKGGQS